MRLKNLNRGWLFCLNAPLEPGKGSHWGYVEDFYRSVEGNSVIDGGMASMASIIWGKPCRKDFRLQPGDGLAFYHGKKARKSSVGGDKRRHIKPYQISFLAVIDTVTQDETSGQVKEITFSYPRDLLQAMRSNALSLGDEDIQAVVKGTGLGGGRVGTFFPIAPDSWKILLKAAEERYGGKLNGLGHKGKGDEGDPFIDQFDSLDSEARKRI